MESVSPRRAKEHHRRLNERLRAEFIAGAEGDWRKRTGRPMTGHVDDQRARIDLNEGATRGSIALDRGVRIPA